MYQILILAYHHHVVQIRFAACMIHVPSVRAYQIILDGHRIVGLNVRLIPIVPVIWRVSVINVKILALVPVVQTHNAMSFPTDHDAIVLLVLLEIHSLAATKLSNVRLNNLHVG